MTKKRLIMTAYTAFAYIAGIAFAVWRTLFIMNNYDPFSAEYESGTDGSLTVMGLLLAVCAAVILTSLFTVKGKNYTLSATSDNQFSVVCYTLCGTAFFCAAILTVVYRHSEIFGSGNLNSAFCSVMEIIALFLMLPVGLYFFTCASVRLNTHTSKKYLSLTLPLWGIAFLCASYSDSRFLYSNPDRKLANMTFICAMLLFLLEARAMVGRPSGKLRFAFSLITTVMMFAYCVPTFLLIAFWNLDVYSVNIVEIAGIGIIFYSAAVSVSAITSQETT